MAKTIPVLIIFVFVCTGVSVWAAPEDDGTYSCTRYTESIPARDGGTIEACVYKTGAPGERPLIIFRHGFSRTKSSLDGYGSHWASRGFNVILNDARTGLRPDYLGKDSDDMIDCVDWAVQKSKESGHYLYGAVQKNAVVIGGYSAGGYTALIAAHKNHAQGEGDFSCATMVLYDPYPTDDNHAAALARDLHVPSIMLHGDDGICNGRGKGKIMYRNTAGPTYAIHIKDASHCDFEPQSSFGCAVFCLGTWDSVHNTAVKRYATAMIEAYAGGDPAAYPYINGPIAQSDTTITVYPESRDLILPPQAASP
jgi:dienelactone hydrolase